MKTNLFSLSFPFDDAEQVENEAVSDFGRLHDFLSEYRQWSVPENDTFAIWFQISIVRIFYILPIPSKIYVEIQRIDEVYEKK